MCDLLTPRNEHEETFGISEALYTGPTCEDCRRPTTEYGICPDCLSLRQELEDSPAQSQHSPGEAEKWRKRALEAEEKAKAAEREAQHLKAEAARKEQAKAAARAVVEFDAGFW